jgi:hypothetical protein
MKVYVITADTDQYEIQIKWNVKASLSKESAIDYVNKLNSFLDENEIPHDRRVLCPNAIVLDNVLDPDFNNNFDGYGVKYTIEEVELLEN